MATQTSPPPPTADSIPLSGVGGPIAPPPTDRGRPWLTTPRWNRFTILQLTVMALAALAPAAIAVAVAAAVAGVISVNAMVAVALAAGENPGMITFGAMFLASPVQWVTGRSQIRVRKYLGIVFFLLAFSNGAMFVIEQGLLSSFSAPFLIAGSVALLAALPLFLTSSQRSQRAMGMSNWRLLHRATYLVAAALMAHVLLIGDIGPGFVLIGLGFIARIPPVRRLLSRRADQVG